MKMMMHSVFGRFNRMVVGCLFGAALSFASSDVQAAPIWNIDFDSMTVGEKVAVSAYVPGEVNSRPQTVGSGTVTIRNNFSVTKNDVLVTLPGNSMVIEKTQRGTGTGDATRVTMTGVSADYEAKTDYQLKFSALLDEAAFDSNTSLNIRLGSNVSANYVGTVVFSSDGRLQVGSTYATTVTHENSWTWGEVLNVVLQVDVADEVGDKDYFRVIINGVVIESLELNPTGTQNLGVNRFFFQANSDNTLLGNGIGINGIVSSKFLDPIPEPSHVALMTVGGILAFGAAKRKIAPRP